MLKLNTRLVATSTGKKMMCALLLDNRIFPVMVAIFGASIIQNQLTIWLLSFITKIGPIPVDDDVGKEVITRLTANMATNSTFYTDSNGRDFLKRVIIFIIYTLDICYCYLFI